MSTPTITPNGNLANLGPWQYNAMVRIVSHEAHACKTCTVWACHYILSVLDNEPSLTSAEQQCEMVIHSGLTAENAMMQHNLNTLQQAHDALQLNNNLLQQTNASLLRKIDIVRIELASTCDDLSGICC